MKIHFIRHGEPDYSYFTNNDHVALPSLAPLTQTGIKQANDINTKLLKNAQIIICSPYTRALQTAHIVSINTNKELIVDYNLFEWLPDKSFNSTVKQFAISNKNYKKDCNSEDMFETKNELHDRLIKVLDKYKEQYDEIIIVAHQRLISSVIEKELEFCELFEFFY